MRIISICSLISLKKLAHGSQNSLAFTVEILENGNANENDSHFIDQLATPEPSRQPGKE
jgi:hypothetical protein